MLGYYFHWFINGQFIQLGKWCATLALNTHIFFKIHPNTMQAIGYKLIIHLQLGNIMHDLARKLTKTWGLKNPASKNRNYASMRFPSYLNRDKRCLKEGRWDRKHRNGFIYLIPLNDLDYFSLNVKSFLILGNKFSEIDMPFLDTKQK